MKEHFLLLLDDIEMLWCLEEKKKSKSKKNDGLGVATANKLSAILADMFLFYDREKTTWISSNECKKELPSLKITYNNSKKI